MYDLQPPKWMRRKPVPTTVGRLDRDTTGLVLVTGDHHLVHHLISPRRKVPKVYIVVLDRPNLKIPLKQGGVEGVIHGIFLIHFGK